MELKGAVAFVSGKEKGMQQKRKRREERRK